MAASLLTRRGRFSYYNMICALIYFIRKYEDEEETSRLAYLHCNDMKISLNRVQRESYYIGSY